MSCEGGGGGACEGGREVTWLIFWRDVLAVLVVILVRRGGVLPVRRGGVLPVRRGGVLPVRRGGVLPVRRGGVLPVRRGGVLPVRRGGVPPVRRGGVLLVILVRVGGLLTVVDREVTRDVVGRIVSVTASLLVAAVVVVLERDTAGERDGGTSLGTAGGTELGTPGDIVGTPGDIVGTPADIVGTPGEIVGTPGDIVGTPGEIVGTPGEIVGTAISDIGTPGEREVLGTAGEGGSTEDGRAEGTGVGRAGERDGRAGERDVTVDGGREGLVREVESRADRVLFRGPADKEREGGSRRGCACDIWERWEVDGGCPG